MVDFESRFAKDHADFLLEAHEFYMVPPIGLIPGIIDRDGTTHKQYMAYTSQP